MTDLTSNLNEIQVEETSYKSSVGENVYQRIGETINYYIDNIPMSVGEFKWSVLTEEQFQARRGTNWVLADGRDITGSDLANELGITNIPDARGCFLRGLDNGAGVDTGRTMASYQEDQNNSHRHGTGYQSNSSAAGNANDYWSNFVAGFGGGGFVLLANNNPITNKGTSGTTGTEFRPLNICLNLFIKIGFSE